MKGTLHKSINYGWMVQDAEDSFYPLHPYDKFTNSIARVEGKEVDFILEDFWNVGLDEKLIKVAIISAKIVDVPQQDEIQCNYCSKAVKNFMAIDVWMITDDNKNVCYECQMKNHIGYGSKGSDECQFEPSTNTSSATICKHCGREKFMHTELQQINQDNPVTRGSTALVSTSSQTDENGKPLTYWGGVDFSNKNAHLIKSNTTTSSQTEISNEEIEIGAENAWSDYEYEEGNLYSTTFKGGWKLAIKWYREQLKQKRL